MNRVIETTFLLPATLPVALTSVDTIDERLEPRSAKLRSIMVLCSSPDLGVTLFNEIFVVKYVCFC